ncbi:glycerophosphodiester phosphodiesterase family protein [Thalassomonas actiniarum]|uniref:glycerophosphodiester phosphodiesterase n=1 Tax=Thalassomonas actiniarum TaxID=485447 RepID=A0AAE9YQL9_9GAMM|nr:glycerophosphodiester phosphodiesterase family protein [Thalassomonas actiniarum]WDD97781.1 glycerophosphodiester phosphodiesterase [Thalassomonas actiniarum]
MKSFAVNVSVISLALTLSACKDEEVKVVEVDKPVIVENTVTLVERVEVPVLVTSADESSVQLGSRPFFLVDTLPSGELKTKLQQCSDGPFYRTDFSIGHRGAAMQYPEHTKESYTAAARMGAGIVECDVTFTQDQALVCRHSQCDLHTTTNILAMPEIAASCTTPFIGADVENNVPAQAKCCTSDITLAQFKQLEGKMDAANPMATTVEEYMDATPSWRTDLYAGQGTLMTHAESIELFKALGVKMTPELKSPSVTMPFNGFSQQDYAQKMLDEYKAAGVAPADVYPQSFNLADVQYWIANESEFGGQAVYLDGRYDDENFDITNSDTWSPSMAELAADGVKIIAPPLWMLVTLDGENNIVPSAYATQAKAAGLDIITWTLERSGPLGDGGGWYYQTINEVINNDGQQLELLDVLAQQVGVIGVFADWPGTVSYYASCMDMPLSR